MAVSATSSTPSQSLRTRLAPELPAWSSLGIASADDLLESELPVERARWEERGAVYQRLRFPLPGTPVEEHGRMTESPAGAGTGWVVLERWRGVPLHELLRLRLRHPRSVSPAELHWNLLCHLRSCGVGTPEPWAVGSRGEGFVARDSFLVTRALEAGSLRLDRWLAGGDGSVPSAAAIAQAGAALAVCLRALTDSGVSLPALDASGMWVRFSSHPAGERLTPEQDPGCALTQLAAARATHAMGGLRRDGRPALLISAVQGGRIAPRAAIAGRLRLLQRLRASLLEAVGDASGPARVAALLSASESLA